MWDVERLHLMKTIALRLYGKMDVRLESFQLPDPGEDEILAEVVCDTVCMSSYKLLQQGSEHKRVPANITQDPIIIGHEFAGRLLKVGQHWQKYYREGETFAGSGHHGQSKETRLFVSNFGRRQHSRFVPCRYP